MTLLVFLMAFTFPFANKKMDAQPVATPAGDNCTVENSVFEGGEELTYKLYYNWNFVWLSAGEVTFRVKDLGNEYYVSAIGKTYKSYEWFFKVEDKYEVWVDKETLLPKRSIRDVQEGKYTVYDKITFDHNKRKVSSLRGKTKEAATLVEYDVENCIHDVLSVIYFTRNLNVDSAREGQDFPVKIFIDKKTWPLKVKYMGKDTNKKIRGLGHFKTVKVSPEVVTGYVFNDKSRMIVWASDDDNKLPLLIESPVRVGTAKAVLKSYKGLRYPLSAKIKEDDGKED